LGTLVQLDRAYRGRAEEGVRDEILAFAKENLSPYKIPKIIEFMEELPLTPIGKVDKKALRKTKKEVASSNPAPCREMPNRTG